MDEMVMWLWPEGRDGEHLRGWTPDETRRFPELTGIKPAIRNPYAVITGQCAVPLETGLPRPLTDWLVARLRQTSRLRLCLTADLPAAWQRFPYEWLMLDGAPLHDRLQVWRYVPRTAEPPAPVRPAPVALLNLWPDTEAIHLLTGLAVSPIKVHRYDGRWEIEALLRRQDVRTYSALCLIVHGSEPLDILPFKLPDQSLWELPPLPLPPLVILLACSDSNGKLIDYAATLLQRGAVTVLAAIGKPDPRDAAALLPRLLQGWLAGERIGEALAAVHAATRWQGQGRWGLLGAGRLRMSDTPTLTDQPVDWLGDRAQAGEDVVLHELLSRLTLQAFLTGGQWSQATQSLRDHLALPELGAPDANRSLLHRLAPIIDTLPVLPRLWVAPLLTHLAEQHDYQLLKRCQRRLADLAQAHPESASLYADWAKADYRRGYYAQAAATTMAGLRCATGTDEITVRLLGSLVNILLDLNLPGPAQGWFDLWEQRLEQLGGDFGEQERFKGRDVQGRLALRQGQVSAAMAWFRRKRIEAPDHNETGHRELAWLLYAAALTGPVNDAARYAEECQAVLADHPEPGSGNDEVLYLLRALAAWTWRRRDGTAWDVLASWLPELENGLERRQDTGPVGFTLSYLHLYQQESGETLALPDWGTIRVGLQGDRYFFELAVFSALLERPRTETADWLNRYQRERRAVIEGLTPANLPDWLPTEPSPILPDDLNDQESRERQLLLSAAPPDWNALVAAHLLPW